MHQASNLPPDNSIPAPITCTHHFLHSKQIKETYNARKRQSHAQQDDPNLEAPSTSENLTEGADDDYVYDEDIVHIS